MDDKPIPPPTTSELAPSGKGETLSVKGIASTARGFVEVLSPTDSVLKAKGGRIDIYKEVLRDDQVKSTLGQRHRGVTSCEWAVEPGAEDAASKQAAKAIEENLREIEFDRITAKALFAVFYGYAVGECMWTRKNDRVWLDDIKFRDRKRFRFGLQHQLFLCLDGNKFEEMPERKFWTLSTGADHDDEPYGLGLAHWLYWPVFFKRSDIKFWLIFLEKFGMPTSKATLPPGMADDEAMRKKALEVLEAIQVDGGVVVPEGMTIELIEAARSGTADYKGMKEAMDAAIAKIVLSQTMTTDNGSSRSQAEVHEGVKDEVVKDDADFVCEAFNRTVVKWLTEWNFPNATPPRVWRVTEPPEDLSVRAERDVKIKNLGYEPTEEYMLETYGKGWVKSQQANSMVPGDASPFQRPPPASTEEFAEAAALAALKTANRSDQIALQEAAQAFSERFESILGDRVKELLSFAEQSGDYETFQKHLNDMLAGVPKPGTVNAVHRASFFARLLGSWRAQR